MDKLTPIPFTSSDSWVFMSVAIGGRSDGATLRDLVATGDYVNHAIMRTDQLRRGFAKLTAAGYVREEAGRFFLTDEGRLLYGRASGGSDKTPMAIWDALDELLAVCRPEADQSALDNERWSYPGVSDQAVREAIEEYQREYLARHERSSGQA